MSTVTYTKPGRAPRLVETPADRVAAEFEGFKPEEDSKDEAQDEVAPQDQSETLGQAPETDDTESGLPAEDNVTP